MEFKKYKLNEVLTLNPTLKLKKNTIAKKIAMENIKEYQKKIDSFAETYKKMSLKNLRTKLTKAKSLRDNLGCVFCVQNNFI